MRSKIVKKIKQQKLFGILSLNFPAGPVRSSYISLMEAISRDKSDGKI
jgi:hypothetical protein